MDVVFTVILCVGLVISFIVLPAIFRYTSPVKDGTEIIGGMVVGLIVTAFILNGYIFMSEYANFNTNDHHHNNLVGSKRGLKSGTSGTRTGAKAGKEHFEVGTISDLDDKAEWVQ